MRPDRRRGDVEGIALAESVLHVNTAAHEAVFAAAPRKSLDAATRALREFAPRVGTAAR